MFLAHMDHSGKFIHQHIPCPLDILGARIEYLVMKILGWLTDWEWLYRYSVTERFITWLANRIVLPLIHGEVLTLEEVEDMVRELEREGCLMAIGICECRHGENNIDPEMVDGVDPNFTCVMIGDWGKGHLYNFPAMYKRVSADELIETARFWHERAGPQRLGAYWRARLRRELLPLPAGLLCAAEEPGEAGQPAVPARVQLRGY